MDIPSPFEVEPREVEKHNEDEQKKQRKDAAVVRGQETASNSSEVTSNTEGSGQVQLRRRKVGMARQMPIEGEIESTAEDGSVTTDESHQRAPNARGSNEARIHGNEEINQIRLNETSASLAAALEVVEERIMIEDKYLFFYFLRIMNNIYLFILMQIIYKNKKNIEDSLASYLSQKFLFSSHVFSFMCCSSVKESKSTVNILDDIGSMFDDLADQLDAMLD